MQVKAQKSLLKRSPKRLVTPLIIQEEQLTDDNQASFWGPGSRLRQRWLAQFNRLTRAFAEVTADESVTGLHIAASVGFSNLVRELVKIGYNNELNVCDSLHNTPLHLAAYFGRPNIVEQLLFHGGVDIDNGIKTGNMTPLGMGAAHSNIRVMQILLDGKADPDGVLLDGLDGLDAYWSVPVINAAIHSGSLDAVKLVIARGAAVSYEPEKSGWCPLEDAAGLPDRTIFDYLLEKEEKLQQHDYDKALIAAAESGNVEVFTVLLEHEHDSEVLQEALKGATEDANWEVIKILLEKHAGIDCNDLLKELGTSIDNLDKFLEVVWTYSQTDGNPDITEKTLNDTLYEATDKEKGSTVELLLRKCNADANAKGDE
jgi:ankyrin repeat protein